MQSKFAIVGLIGAFLLGGSVFGQQNGGSGSEGGSGQNQEQNQNQEETRDGLQQQLGPLYDQLKQLRYEYRKQVRVLLIEREELIAEYRAATEQTTKERIARQIREHQTQIAETHRQLRRQLRDEIREIRHQRRLEMENPGG